MHTEEDFTVQKYHFLCELLSHGFGICVLSDSMEEEIKLNLIDMGIIHSQNHCVGYRTLVSELDLAPDTDQMSFPAQNLATFMPQPAA